MAKASKKPVPSRASTTRGARPATKERGNAKPQARRPARGKAASGRSPRPAPEATSRKARPAPKPLRAPNVLPIEVEPGPVEETFEKLRGELAHWVNKGRYTRVRFRLRGKPILPDIPVGALLAAEAATFWWAGLLQALLVNVGAKALLDVELVSEADVEVSRGKAALLSGDLERAMQAFRRALEMDRGCASAHLNLGIAAKLKGDFAAARASLGRAQQLDPSGPCGSEARRLLEQPELSKPSPAEPA